MSSAVGAWTHWYNELGRIEPLAYGDSLTYHLGAAFLGDCDTVEDWGCGLGYMRLLVKPDCYRGLDGSPSGFEDEVVDLRTYKGRADGIFVRHVLEHNYGWQQILANAVAAFRQRLVLVIFTPFSERTRVLSVGQNVVVPDISFAKADITQHFWNLHWREETYETKTQYGTETIFYVSRQAIPCN